MTKCIGSGLGYMMSDIEMAGMVAQPGETGQLFRCKPDGEAGPS